MDHCTTRQIGSKIRSSAKQAARHCYTRGSFSKLKNPTFTSQKYLSTKSVRGALNKIHPTLAEERWIPSTSLNDTSCPCRDYSDEPLHERNRDLLPPPMKVHRRPWIHDPGDHAGVSRAASHFSLVLNIFLNTIFQHCRNISSSPTLRFTTSRGSPR